MKNLLRRGVSGLLAVVFAFTLSVKCLSPKAYAITPAAALAAVSLASFCSGFCFSLGADAEDLAWSYLFDGTEDDYVASLDSTVITNSDVYFRLPMHLTDACISSINSALDSGYISSFNFDGNRFEYTQEKYVSSRYGDYYWFLPSPSPSIYSDPFSVSIDGDYIFATGTFESRFFFPASGTWTYGVGLEVLDSSGSWVRCTSIKLDSYTLDDSTAIRHYSGKSSTVSLLAGSSYRFYLYISDASWSASSPGEYIGYSFCYDFSGSTLSRSGVTVVPDSTRPSGLSTSINSYNSGDNSTNYYIGTIAEDGSVVNTYNFDLFNESTMTVKNPSTGDSWTVSSWEYDYTTRSYDCITADGDTISITYGDDYITFMYPDSDGVFHKDYYYYVVSEYSGSSSGSDCDHAYTSETTLAPTCTQAGERTYTCALCGYSYVDAVPATGHDWETTERVDTETNDNGDVTILGYTVYTCSSCGEIYKAYDQDGQPTSPPGAPSSGGDSVLDAISSIYAEQQTQTNLITAIKAYLESVVSKIDALQSYVALIVQRLTDFSNRNHEDLENIRLIVAELRDSLVSPEDEALRDAQKDNVTAVTENFASGSSGSTSLGVGDFKDIADIGTTFKDYSSLNGQSSVSSFIDGLADADAAGQGWFSEATRSTLDAVSSPSTVQEISPDAIADSASAIDLYGDEMTDDDPYHMGSFVHRYAWLWGGSS